ncbi:hypothetical protein X975_02670, partial [Stegodyphus mimosarum]
MSSDSVLQSETVVIDGVAQAGKKNIPACDICYITATSFRHLKQHFEGRKHKQKLKKWKDRSSKKLTEKKSEPVQNIQTDFSSNEFSHSGVRNERLNAEGDRYFSRSEMDRSFDQNHLPYYDREFRFNASSRSWREDRYTYYGPNYQINDNFKQSANKNTYRDNWLENSNNCSKWNYASRYSDDYDTRNAEVKHYHSKNILNKPYEKRSRFHKTYSPVPEPSSSKSMNNEDIYTSENIFHSNVNIESPQNSSLYGVQKNNKYEDKSCRNSSDVSISGDSNEQKNKKKLSKSSEIASNSSAVCKPSINLDVIEEMPLTLRSVLKAKRLSTDAEHINLSPSTSGASKEIGSDRSNEKRPIISENMPDRIARLINPSNQKDKAAVSHLITELSKTKKKLNLSRLKLQSSDMGNEKDKESNEMMHEITGSSVDVPRSEEESLSPNFPAENGHPLERNNIFEAYERQPECSSQNLKQSDSNNINTTDFLLEKSPQVIESISKKKKSIRISTSPKFSKQEKKPAFEECSADVRDAAAVVNGNTYDGSKANKRKKTSTSRASKKHRCSSAECLEACINDAINQSCNSNVVETDNSSQVTESQGVTNSATVNCEIFVKNEPPDPDIWDSGNIYAEAVDNAGEASRNVFDHSLPPVESMMNMFAAGMVKVEKDNDFSDPVIDTIKEMDPQEFSKFFSDKIHSTTTILESSKPQDTPDESSISGSNIKSSSVHILNMNTDAASPAINDEFHLNKINQNSFLNTDSIATNVNVVDASTTANLRKTLESLSNGENIHSLTDLLSATNSRNEKKLLVTNEDLQPLSNEPPQLEVLVNKLTEITTFEEKVKNDLQEARQKIHEYQTLLETWRDKKRHLLEEEEKLRAKRNEIIKAMPKVLPKGTSESCMVQSKCGTSDHCLSSTVEADTIQKTGADLNNKNSSEIASLVLDTDEDSITQNDITDKDDEDICILSPTIVPDNTAIPVIDLEASPVKDANVETSTLDEYCLFHCFCFSQ